MKNFMDWLAEDAPEFVIALCAILTVSLTIFAVVISVIALNAGLWIAPVLVWIIIPSLAIMVAYNRRD